MKKTNYVKQALAWVKSLFVNTYYEHGHPQGGRSQPIMLTVTNATDQCHKNVEILGIIDNLHKENENWGLPAGVTVENGLKVCGGNATYKKILYYLDELGEKGKPAFKTVVSVINTGKKTEAEFKPIAEAQVNTEFLLNYMHCGDGYQRRMNFQKDIYQHQDNMVQCTQKYYLNKFLKIIIREILPQAQLNINIFPEPEGNISYTIKLSLFNKLLFFIRNNRFYIRANRFFFGYKKEVPEANPFDFGRGYLMEGTKKVWPNGATIETNVAEKAPYIIQVKNTTDKEIKDVVLLDAITRSNPVTYPGPAYGNPEGIEITNDIPQTSYMQFLMACIVEPFETQRIEFKLKDSNTPDLLFQDWDDNQKAAFTSKNSGTVLHMNEHLHNGCSSGQPMLFKPEYVYDKDADKENPETKDLLNFYMLTNRKFRIDGNTTIIINKLLPQSTLMLKIYPKREEKTRTVWVPGIFMKISNVVKSYFAEREIRKMINEARKTDDMDDYDMICEPEDIFNEKWRAKHKPATEEARQVGHPPGQRPQTPKIRQ